MRAVRSDVPVLLSSGYSQQHISEQYSAMGITGFTLPTLYKWIRSKRGIENSLHPFQKGHFLGSGPGAMVLKEAGLDGESQFAAVMKYVKA